MRENIAVLHVSQPTSEGVARVVEDLVRDQVARGWDVTVACPLDGPLRDNVVRDGAAHRAWAASRSPGIRTARETASLRTVVSQTAPAVVHLHSSKAGLSGRLAMRGSRPTVFQPHGWSFWAATGVAGWGALHWERIAGRWTDALVCVGEAERAAGIARGISAPWVVVRNGVDLTRWTSASEAAKGEARARLGLGPEPLAVCVGRLTRQKGQDVLVAAWPLVRAEIPGALLVLVGDGPDRSTLQRTRGPGVELVGAQDDVASWLAACDVAVLPSRWEGMSLSLLEAMASGRPVVATDVAGMREVLSRGGGEVVPVEDVSALARALTARLKEGQILPAEGARARATIEEHYDLRVTTDRIAQIYEDVLSRRSR
ncbi:MAG: glycosyltransferase [Actinomycetota bacterium]|nr:glycosyltransferase [Actinomycetota bacterium]